MRNPALHLVGIAASPGGGGLFGTRAEEELRQWLELRLDALGIDPIAYSRFVLSLLRHPDSALTPPVELADYSDKKKNISGSTGGRRTRAKLRSKQLPINADKDHRRAVVQCLKSAADQKCGVESLVDELCTKLKDLEGSQEITNDEFKKPLNTTATKKEVQVPFEALTPRDRALRYYAAFPALQSTNTTSKNLQEKVNYNIKNINSDNKNNINFITCYNNNKKNKSVTSGSFSKSSNKAHQKKTKIILSKDSEKLFKEQNFEFKKPMENNKEKQEQIKKDNLKSQQQESELDKIKLAQLQAKFDESLEALWNSGSGGITQGMDSIWAAPSLSIPLRPLWPTDAQEVSYPMITWEGNKKEASNPLYHYQKNSEIGDVDSPLVTWQADLFSIKNYEDKSMKSNVESWSSDSTIDKSWCWDKLENAVRIDDDFQKHNRSHQNKLYKSPVTIGNEPVRSFPEPEEDLLTSARTHFRPIKDDECWADGTTFPINNTIEEIRYRRSESGNILYLPGSSSPYMEYQEKNNLAAPFLESSRLKLKFRVKQCDKSIQTEPACSPVKRRILSEQNCFYSKNLTASKIDIVEENSLVDNNNSFNLDHTIMVLGNDRKRRHSSSLISQSLTTLRPLTL